MDLTVYAGQVAACHAALHGGSLALSGWLEPRPGASELEKVQAAAARIAVSGSALVLLGVGGSYLGGRAAYELLTHCRPDAAPRLYWGGWNLSALYHQQLLRELDAERDIAVCVISKQGESIETQAAFDLLKGYLLRRYGGGWRERVYAVTDPVRGALRAEAVREGYIVLAAPPDVAGRYSLFTAVGLLPLATAGLDIGALLDGAARAAAELNNSDLKANPCYQYAAAGLYAHRELGKAVELFAVGEPQMSFFARWLQQLFAESEGKQGKGIFPADVLYSGDLHTVGEFFAGGTPLFLETLIFAAANPAEDGAAAGMAGYDALNRRMWQTVTVSHSRLMPVNCFTMAALDAHSLGYTAYFFMKAAAMRALMFGCDPFGQPAVDAYKRRIRQAAKGEEA